MSGHCDLCAAPGGVVVWQEPGWRIVRVIDADFPAYYRVIVDSHVVEFTDLSEAAQLRCMALVTLVERHLRQHVAPTKVNLAALGNVIPHIHWHVVARFDWDSHFPQPIWGLRQREVAPDATSRLAISLTELDATLTAAIAAAS